VLALEGRYGTRGLRVVGVSSFDPDEADTERRETEEAAREEKMDYPTYLDTRSAWMDKARVADIPAFVLIGPDGRVLHRQHGKLVAGSPAFVELDRAVTQALAKAGR
jgi:hypothetical protein